MIYIHGDEFFLFKVEQSKNFDKDHAVLIQIYTDPSYFELPQYKKIPFMSIVAYNFNLNIPIHDLHTDYDEMNVDEYATPKDDWYEFPRNDNKYYCSLVDVITEYLETHSFEKYSVYVDERFSFLTSKFSDSNRYHTLIFEEKEYKDQSVFDFSENYCVIGYPVTGIISPIPRSELFELYNASLVVMNNSPFLYEDVICNKLMYALVNVYSHFTFTEYVKDQTSDISGRGIVYTNIFGLSDDENDTANMTHYKIKTVANIFNQKHEYFDGKVTKNIFYLTDIPKSVKLRGAGRDANAPFIMPATM